MPHSPRLHTHLMHFVTFAYCYLNTDLTNDHFQTKFGLKFPSLILNQNIENMVNPLTGRHLLEVVWGIHIVHTVQGLWNLCHIVQGIHIKSTRQMYYLYKRCTMLHFLKDFKGFWNTHLLIFLGQGWGTFFTHIAWSHTHLMHFIYLMHIHSITHLTNDEWEPKFRSNFPIFLSHENGNMVNTPICTHSLLSVWNLCHFKRDLH